MQEAKSLRKGINLELAADSSKKESHFLKRIALWGTVLFLVFLLGFVPTWLSGRETLRQRDAAQANLRLSQLQNRLATAAINAGRGEYEPARIAASDFFTDLRAEVDRQESGFNLKQREAVGPILSKRDEVITLLARYDQTAGEQLADLYLKYLKAVNPSAPKQP